MTAGNSSPLSDGAAALLITTPQKAEQLKLKPMARIVASATAGVHPNYMGIGPIPASQKALKRAGLTIEQIDLVEIERGFRVPSSRLHSRARHRSEKTERQRRRHRSRPSARLQRRADHDNTHPRNEKARQPLRPRDHVHRRRPRHRDDRRKNQLSALIRSFVRSNRPPHQRMTAADCALYPSG